MKLNLSPPRERLWRLPGDLFNRANQWLSESQQGKVSCGRATQALILIAVGFIG
jgi:hypothetical protein